MHQMAPALNIISTSNVMTIKEMNTTMSQQKDNGFLITSSVEQQENATQKCFI